MDLINHIDEKDIKIVKIDTSDIIFSNEIREYCKENKCGKYDKNYMCPPSIGDVSKYKILFKSYTEGIALLLKDNISNHSINKVYKSQIKLHNIILKLENKAKKSGYERAKGFIAGECQLCVPCKKTLNEKCLYPNKSRTSLEAIGVNVISSLENKGIKIDFSSNNITWVGYLLLK